MSAEVPDAFDREHGFTEAEWLRCLPGAVAPHALARPAPGQAVVTLGVGRLHLDWAVLPPRRIALLQMPRLAVRYCFDGVDAGTRRAFIGHFDLYMHRGGG